MADDIELRIEPARESDTPIVHRMIRALVDYERLTHEFTVTESILRAALFGERPAAEVALGYVGTEPVGFAVYVQPAWRDRGLGRKLFAHVAKVAFLSPDTRSCAA